jgi:hypothetical protein
MKSLFYMLLLPNDSGEYDYGGAFQSREKAEEKARELSRPSRIEPVTSDDFGGTPYA